MVLEGVQKVIIFIDSKEGQESLNNRVDELLLVHGTQVRLVKILFELCCRLNGIETFHEESAIRKIYSNPYNPCMEWYRNFFYSKNR